MASTIVRQITGGRGDEVRNCEREKAERKVMRVLFWLYDPGIVLAVA